MLLGALEVGGTKMVCALGTEDGQIKDRAVISTGMPQETLERITGYFSDKNIAALGVASFGPIDLDKDSKTYGYITSTPKKGWENFDLLGTLKRALKVPMGFDTDVNGSLLGEVTYGRYKGISDAVYITVGTGIGGGVMSGGRLVHGMLHPELGHIKLIRHPSDTYVGKCPFHDNCLEGLASGPAIEERWGARGALLGDRREVWELEAYYLGQAIGNYILVLSPKVIILGGGVMHQERLFPLIRAEVKKYLNGYINTAELEALDDYIVPASLGDDQGILGAIKLAAENSLAEL